MQSNEITVESVLADPKSIGFPTLEEFARNPEKYRKSINDKMGRIDQSTQTFKNVVEKQVYKILGYEVKTLEEVERIANNEGFDLLNCKFCPQVVPTIAGKCKIVVEFKPKVMSKLLDQFGRFFGK